MSLARGALIAISMLVVACAPTAPSPPVADSSVPSISGAPVIISDPPEAPGDGAATVTAQDVSMTVRVVTPRIAVGGVVDIAVTIQNDRQTDLEHAVRCDAAATATARLPVPQEPEGRAWGGIAGEFKAYALRQGMGPGAVPALDPITVNAPALPCRGFEGERTLEAGGTITGALRLPTEVIEGVPTAPGTYEVEVLFLYDRQGPADGLVRYEQLVLTAEFTIEGPAPPVVSAGQAVDAMLAQPRFAGWLAQQPSRTWSIANLYLIDGDGMGGIVPPGITWSVELFREMGVPRNWFIGYVDAFTGAVRGLNSCDNPCDR